MEKSEIILIYAEKCDDCKRMKKILQSALEESNLVGIVTIKAFESESDDAVEIALSNGIYDIPGCSINGESFYGKDFDAKAVREAVFSLLH